MPKRTPRMLVALLAATVAAWSAVRAGEPLPSDLAIETAIDREVDARLASAGVTPAPEADDATLVRRLTLDLAGRVPTASEVRDYVESTKPDKRGALVERLMNSAGYVRHQADWFDAMLMAGVKGSLRDYLTLALREGRPWDRVFRELLIGDESEPGRKGSVGFVKARAADLDRLTGDVSTVFFGVNVSCARCHDHPLVRAWTQEHYFGMKSFLARTYEAGGFVGERDYGRVKYKTVGGEERSARFMFLTGRVVDVPGGDEPSKATKDEEKRQIAQAKTKKVPPPAPKVSARGMLAEAALRPEERDYFAKAIVNRLWARFLGRGLVMPLDQMHPANPPSHPDLLDWLGRDMVDHGYDLRRLIRGLVMSKAYARSSRWESGMPPEAKLFAVAPVRPLTARQLALSMWVATTDPASLPDDRSALDAKIEPLADRSRPLASAMARPGEDYQIGVAEALLMSNSDRLNDLLSDGDGRLVGRLSRIGDPRERAIMAVRNVLGRPADEEEISILVEYLSRHRDRESEGSRRLVWTLLTGAEFRFNH